MLKYIVATFLFIVVSAITAFYTLPSYTAPAADTAGIPQEQQHTDTKGTQQAQGSAPPHIEQNQRAQEDASTTPKQPTNTSVLLETTSSTTDKPEKKTIASASVTSSSPTTPPPLYDTPPRQFDDINTAIAPAVINILCMPQQGSPIDGGATGSGVIIDPRGVILTNAHVAQYILFSERPELHMQCTIRIGSPAQPRYTARVIAFPSTWVTQHAEEIKLETPTGTGEHDWALVYITGRTDGSNKPTIFPFASFDSRHAIVQKGDPVLVYGYPAGFLGGVSVLRYLYPSSSVVSIHNVFTFRTGSLDVLSLGGSIVAQGGASGGGVFNAWGKLIGIIVTTSIAETTAERDLRAITLYHIDQSVRAHLGMTLLDILQYGNFDELADDFARNMLPYLLEEYTF